MNNPRTPTQIAEKTGKVALLFMVFVCCSILAIRVSMWLIPAIPGILIALALYAVLRNHWRCNSAFAKSECHLFSVVQFVLLAGAFCAYAVAWVKMVLVSAGPDSGSTYNYFFE